MPQEDLLEQLRRVVDANTVFRKRISDEAKKLAEEREAEKQRGAAQAPSPNKR